MSTRRFRARLDRLEESVKKRQANGWLSRGPTAAPSDDSCDGEFLQMKRMFGELSPEEERELDRWGAQHAGEPVEIDPDDEFQKMAETFADVSKSS